MILDLVSDLHGYYPKLEGGDLLIVAGDLAANDSVQAYIEFATWLGSQDYRKIVLIAGNHDNQLRDWVPNRDMQMNYLCDSGCEFEGLRIWGSPWTRSFPGMNPHCKAFVLDTEDQLADKWDLIPAGIDILVTHSPPLYILDATSRGESVGSSSLYDQVELRIRPKLHVFGHIHEGYGQMDLYDPTTESVRMYRNCSHVNDVYDPVNPPMRVIL